MCIDVHRIRGLDLQQQSTLSLVVARDFEKDDVLQPLPVGTFHGLCGDEVLRVVARDLNGSLAQLSNELREVSLREFVSTLAEHANFTPVVEQFCFRNLDAWATIAADRSRKAMAGEEDDDSHLEPEPWIYAERKWLKMRQIPGIRTACDILESMVGANSLQVIGDRYFGD